MPKSLVVREYQRGLLYRDGQFIELLPPGRRKLGFVERWLHDWQLVTVDLRETSRTIDGQEVLSSDKIGVRVTLIAQYRVADPVVATHAVVDCHAQLYQDLQLTLREAITARTLEQLLTDREALAAQLAQSVTPRATAYGLAVSRVGVKDLTLPSSVRALYLQEVEAEQKGRADLVAARHEVAAARARANTAKLLQESPQMMQLHELEVLTQIAAKSGNVIVVPGLDRLLSGGDRPAAS